MPVTKQARELFESTEDIVDVDDSVEYPARKFVVVIDRQKAARLGVTQSTVAQALSTLMEGEDMSFLHGKNLKFAVPVRVEYSEADKADLEQVLSLRVRSLGGRLVPLSEIVRVEERLADEELLQCLTSPESWFIGADVFYWFTQTNRFLAYTNQKYKSESEIRQDFPAIQAQFAEGVFPDEVIEATAQRYERAYQRLTGKKL